ncbi:HD domain-containing phosphohydrolase [Fervidobacterium thailandense]|uniref:HD domain-containing phosphohydrolase n=1 Tax=Fervidobacterium thailandense TaxID=1008305 RepID=UPI0019D3D531
MEQSKRLDGSGYPYRKRDGEISLFGQIIGVADVFNALFHKTSLQGGLGTKEGYGGFRERRKSWKVR